MHTLFLFFLPLLALTANAQTLKVGDAAPSFQLSNQSGANFNFETRKGKWTVLYFYPKADTPGCTKQARHYQDLLKPIHDLKAEVFGISINTVKEQADFHKKYKLTFDLLADESGTVTELFGAKMPLLSMAKRWTWIIDPQLMIRRIDTDVDPSQDADKVAKALEELQLNLK